MQFCNIKRSEARKIFVSLQAKVTNMELRVRLRYKSTSDFGKGDHLNFDKSLAHALEWLYDEDQFDLALLHGGRIAYIRHDVDSN